MQKRSLSLILVLMMAGVAGATDYYSDGAQTGVHHAGTKLDPYSEEDMNATDLPSNQWAAGDMIYCKGSYHNMHLHDITYGSAVGGNVTWKNWPGFVPDANNIVGPGNYQTTSQDAYLTIDGWKLDKGWSTGAVTSTVCLYRTAYVTITNCTISTARWSLVTTGDLAPYPYTYGGGAYAGIDDGQSTVAHDITITNNTFINCCQGIRINGNNYIVTGNSFDHHISNDGIIATATCDDVLIADNTFSDINSLYDKYGATGNSVGSAVWEGHEGEIIVHSTTADTAYFTIRSSTWLKYFAIDLATAPEDSGDYPVGSKWELQSDPNVFWTCDGGGDQAHCDGIEAVGGDSDGYITIERCSFGTWFSGSGGNIKGQALKLQDNGEDPYIIFRNNIIYMSMDSGYALLLSGAGGDMQIYNNIIIVPNHYVYAGRWHFNTRHFYNNIVSGAVNDYNYDTDCDYNIWFLAKGEGSGQIHNELQGPHDQYSVDPTTLFANYAGFDFNTAFTSTGIDTGDANYTTTSDFTGTVDIRTDNTPPDIGAYEYVGGAGDPNNSAPVLDAIGVQGVDENDSLTFDVNATDADADALTYDCANPPTGATFSTATFTWLPTYLQAGVYNVTFTVTDGNDVDSEEIVITVTNKPQYLLLN